MGMLGKRDTCTYATGRFEKKKVFLQINSSPCELNFNLGMGPTMSLDNVHELIRLFGIQY